MNKNKILIVDDNDFCRDLLAEIFELDYEIIQAKDGREALNALAIQMGSLEAVLLDLVMPQMNGFEFLDELVNKGWFQKVPIIVVSSSTDEETRDKCRSYGVKYFLSKPYKASEALKTIKKAIKEFS